MNQNNPSGISIHSTIAGFICLLSFVIIESFTSRVKLFAYNYNTDIAFSQILHNNCIIIGISFFIIVVIKDLLTQDKICQERWNFIAMLIALLCLVTTIEHFTRGTVNISWQF